jgi:hypothetical protein
VFSNVVALAASIGGYYYRPWLDPVGAIVISMYILFTWYNTGLGMLPTDFHVLFFIFFFVMLLLLLLWF